MLLFLASFYSFALDILVEVGDLDAENRVVTSISRYVSVNDNGFVAFQGSTGEGDHTAPNPRRENIFVYDPNDRSIRPMLNAAGGVFELPAEGDANERAIQQFGTPQINNQNIVLASRSMTTRYQVTLINPIRTGRFYYLEKWNALATGFPVELSVFGDSNVGPAFPTMSFYQPSYALQSGPFFPVAPYNTYRFITNWRWPGLLYSTENKFEAINNSGQIVSSALSSDAVNWFLQTPAGPVTTDNYNELLLPSNPVMPRIADNGLIVTKADRTPEASVNLYDYSLNFIAEIAGSTTGFTVLGERPSISDDGQYVVFYGELSQAGADQLTFNGSPTTPGKGIFIAVNSNDVWNINRVAGISNNGFLDPGESYFDSNFNGQFDPQSGETDEGIISGFLPDEHIDISDDGLFSYVANENLSNGKAIIASQFSRDSTSIDVNSVNLIATTGNLNDECGGFTDLAQFTSISNRSGTSIVFWGENTVGQQGIYSTQQQSGLRKGGGSSLLGCLEPYGLTLKTKPGYGNPIRENTTENNIETIYQQTIDENCNLQDQITAIDDYPFSGVASKSVKLSAIIDICSNNNNSGDLLMTNVDWSINNSNLQGTEGWTGKSGTINIEMPDKIGVYIVSLDFKIGDYRKAIARKLFVTKGKPLKGPDNISIPRLAWYEKATNWASGAIEEDSILDKLMNATYAFGRQNWDYYYNLLPGLPRKCAWEDLIAEPLVCDYSDCHEFSNVFQTMASTLGVSLESVETTGIIGFGFTTFRFSKPSIDSSFFGNVRLEGGDFDRYFFRTHALRKHGIRYYDVTFNDFHFSETEFIEYNANGLGLDTSNLLFIRTLEGAIIYPLSANVYQSWQAYQYAPPLNPILKSTKNNSEIKTIGNPTLDKIDANGDGKYEELVVHVEVESPGSGEYFFWGKLARNGNILIDQPYHNSPFTTVGYLSETAGKHTIAFIFSGEKIFLAGDNGSYEIMIGGDVSASLSLPTIDHSEFREVGARIINVTETTIDTDGNGKFDGIEAEIALDVVIEENIGLRGVLFKNGTIASSGGTFSLFPGTNTVKLIFSGEELHESNKNGPYEGIITLFDKTNSSIGSYKFNTKPYSANDFESSVVTTEIEIFKDNFEK